MVKKSSQSLIRRPDRKSTSQSKSSVSQRSIAAASKKRIVNHHYQHLMEEGSRLERARALKDAEQIYTKITSECPDFSPAWHALGLLAFNYGHYELALKLVSKAVALDPGEMVYHRNLGEISRRVGLLDQAVLSGKNACLLAPKDIDSHYNLGLAYTDMQDYKNAVRIYRKAIKLNPKHGLSWNNLGAALEQQGNKQEALKAYREAIQINNMHAEAQNNSGAIFSELGQIEEARKGFEAAIEARPDFVEAHYNLSTLKTYANDDPHLKMLRNILSKQSQLSKHARIRYYFAFAKALDDVGNYDEAFSAYEHANALEFSNHQLDERKSDELVESIIKVFNSDFFAKRSTWQSTKKSPIFIVGMPRSGTSLLEQILATNPSIYGAGELGDLNEIVSDRTHASESKFFTQEVIHLSENDMALIGNEYCKKVWDLSPESDFIVDKMPANFFYLGLIYLAIPNAKIIHAMRDPMDSCFSCYSRLFNETMGFAYNQESLGKYYVRYMKLMNHWREVLPKDFILDLSYEDLVADIEGQSKRILNFIGVPWDPSYLEFYKNKRTVKTASVVQVRQPIYKTSVARWRHFARHLRPLYEIVKNYRSSEELEYIFQNNEPLNAANIMEPTSALHKDIIDRTIALQGNGDHEGLLHYLQGYGQLVDQSPMLLHLKGISLYRLDRFNEGLACYKKALDLRPQFPLALNSLGFLLQDIGMMDEAKNAFEQALQLAPDFSMARLNLALAQLKLGDWEAGWENYESRWTGSAETANPSFKKPELPLPQWEGQLNTENQSLLVITEQGFGDTFQFARYLRLVSNRFKRVGFVCSNPTHRVLEWSFGDDIVLMNRMSDSLSLWDWYSPLMSLPRAMKTRVHSIPAAQPFFSVPLATKNYWGEKVSRRSPNRLRVGIAWAGRKTHQYDARRSISLDALLPLLKQPHISWFSLQKWGVDEAPPTLPHGIDWIDWTAELIDFGDTAALLSNLDLIISIDSSMVHLAGCLGRPVWMLNRFDSEWRWLGSRVDSPWYPTLKIFNQPSFGDWKAVIDNVASEIKGLHVPQDRIELVAQDVGIPTAQLAKESSNNMQPLSTDKALQIASQLHGSGRANDAKDILQKVLLAEPNNPQALHLLGVIFYQSGQHNHALRLIDDAIAILPSAFFLSNKTEMLRQQGRLNEAIEAGKRAVEIEPTLASGHSNLGVALYDAKEYDAAEVHHHRALSLAPDLIQSLNNLGSIQRARKNRVEAIDWYQKVLTIAPNYTESISNLGAVLIESERVEEAVPVLEKGLELAPNSAELMCNLGLGLFKLEKFDIAQSLLQRSLEIKPNYPEALTGLACIFNEYDRLDEAESLLKKALEVNPNKVDAHCQLAIVYMEQGHSDRAITSFKKALELESDNTEALTGLANLMLEAGEMQKAEEFLNKAIAIDPSNIDARFHLTQSRKVFPEDENVTALESIFVKGEKLSSNKKISLHYALGKAYDDLKEYDKAFHHFERGAQLKRAKLSYDARKDEEFVDNIIRTFDRKTYQTLSGSGSKEKKPIFVLGMPRSGTTLTEQIIASHPDVFGAGELRDLAQVVQGSPPAIGPQTYPEYLKDIGPEDLNRWGSEYINRLSMISPEAKFITDKMPSNYLLMGLIPLMLPNAKIIHVKRDPIDTCLSCFTRLFNRHQDATYDLTELGRHYVSYAKLMDHWRSILPKDSYYEIEYENLVANINVEAKSLIAYCDLEWSESCLSFYENKRAIRTASVAQVRQPLYKSSVARWKGYETHLDPLLEELKKINGFKL